VINDTAQSRGIHIAKSGSDTTVVWNPWAEKEKGFADMAAGEYQQMVCVETCNAADDKITVAPKQTHSLVAVVSVG
jgi:D-hexose-6-phosphate mutarotase